MNKRKKKRDRDRERKKKCDSAGGKKQIAYIESCMGDIKCTV